jgi:hypothetical protein
MSILKKEHKEQFGRAEHKQRAVRSRIKAELSKASGRTFGEDFNLEHSFTIVASTVMAFGANTSSDQPVSRNTFAQDFRSPSCVYLG